MSYYNHYLLTRTRMLCIYIHTHLYIYTHIYRDVSTMGSMSQHQICLLVCLLHRLKPNNWVSYRIFRGKFQCKFKLVRLSGMVSLSSLSFFQFQLITISFLFCFSLSLSNKEIYILHVLSPSFNSFSRYSSWNGITGSEVR